MTKKVFVSYSHHDMNVVDKVVDYLERANLDVWIDRSDIPAAALWQKRIADAIETSEVFPIMLSPDSVLSRNVPRELNLEFPPESSWGNRWRLPQ